MNRLVCIKSPFTSPYLNLAAEEILLKNFREDVFFLYRNEPSVIVGKHQIALAEINYPFVLKNNIPVIRRLSGGGTVYHDLGNLNFSWIVQGEKNKPVNFAKYMNEVFLFLKSLNIDVRQTKNNDLTIGSKKISGNAEHIFKNRLIHHGTLLYNTDLKKLNNALSGHPEKYSAKAVQSKRTKVTNIIDYMSKPVSAEAFADALMHFVKNKHSVNSNFRFNDTELATIKKLAKEKYQSWKWNYGYSPKYEFKNLFKLDNNTFEVIFQVKKGIIQNFSLSSEQLSKQETKILEGKMTGIRHCKEDVLKIFSGNTVFSGLNFSVFEHLLF